MKPLTKISTIIALLFCGSLFASTQVPVPSLAPMLKKVLPAVVNITTKGTPLPLHAAEHQEDPHKPPNFSLASGVIVDAQEGLILTNNHVVEDAKSIWVTLNDGRRLKAKKKGGDVASDIAVLEIEAKDLTQITFQDSDTLAVGDFVVAIGNPFGLNQSVTSGVISALGRSDLRIEGYEDFIQTDASINPGNSGGALVDLNGKLVGLNTAILAPGGGNIGIGFAIPANMAKNIMTQILKFGKVRRGLLGVLVQTLTPELAEAFSLQKVKGAVVDDVFQDSLAEKAGLKPGDIITKVNGHSVTSASSLRNVIGLITLDASLKISIIRDGKPKTIRTKMLNPKNLTSRASRLYPGLAGALLGNFHQILGTHGIVSGVGILGLNPGTPASAKGLQLHDVIVEANHKPITNQNDLKRAIDPSKDLLLRLLRSNGALYVVLKNHE